MMSGADDDDLLAERLNQEPVVFMGYTDSELMLAIKVACLVSFPLACTIGLLLNKGMALLGGGLLFAIALVAGGGKLLQRLKRGKPDFYYQARMNLLLQRLHLCDSGLLLFKGRMHLGRTWQAPG
ncbi:MAG: TIGR03750 family conjugal transfer protein [Candidatus Paceibacterota bacterium]|jgi:conjugative transfer region protein (TIGR03750 family)